MKEVYAFDFDGTLTTKDTLIEFIRYAHGSAALLWGLLCYSPLLILMKLHLYPNYKAKQRIFAHYFAGMKMEDFDKLCNKFAEYNRSLLRSGGITAIDEAIAKGVDVIVVSASIENWVAPFFPHVTVACTKIEVTDGKLTGRFLSKNCYGQEKVNRIAELYPDRSAYRLTAFGDSRGDKEMLDYADCRHYKPFR